MIVWIFMQAFLWLTSKWCKVNAAYIGELTIPFSASFIINLFKNNLNVPCLALSQAFHISRTISKSMFLSCNVKIWQCRTSDCRVHAWCEDVHNLCDSIRDSLKGLRNVLGFKISYDEQVERGGRAGWRDLDIERNKLRELRGRFP